MYNILSVQIDDEGMLQVKVNSEKIGHYALIGILEEIKQGVLENSSVEMSAFSKPQSKKYDA
jgi:hypothetical protein